MSCFLGERWARLFPFAVSDRLLTFGEEADGVGFSPGVKKPKAVTKGEKEEGARLFSSPKVNGREEESSLPLSPKATGRGVSFRARPIDEGDGLKQGEKKKAW